jgi:thioredoxin reductase (NADPH)
MTPQEASAVLDQDGSVQHPLQNLVILGSGPAGFTAAIYAARANLSPLLLTGFQRGGIPGGQLMTTTHVENFPGFPDGILGPELMDRCKAQALRWGTKLLEVDALKIDLTQRPFTIHTSDGELIKTQTLIVATGASANRLHLPQEEKFWSRGISACAICDGATPQFRQEQLAVVGGGDSACEEAVYLTKYGSHVHLIVRGDQFRASAAMVDRVYANSSITVHWKSEVVDVYGEEWLKGITLRDRASNFIQNLDVRGLFYAIGHTPNTDLLQGQLDLDAKGYISTKPGRPETSRDGVFAAGDVADSEWRQGITAALAAERWLSHHQLAVTVARESVEPNLSGTPIPTATSDVDNFSESAIWQKGPYALRRLYHESEKPLLVVYTSPTCGPCHVLKPQIKRVLNELNGNAQGVEIDIEADQDIARQAGITGTPTIQLFMNKELKKQWQGVKQRSEFRHAIDQLLQ